MSDDFCHPTYPSCSHGGLPAYARLPELGQEAPGREPGQGSTAGGTSLCIKVGRDSLSRRSSAPGVVSRRARQGLTLIELLVAIAIIVLLLGVVYLVYGTVLNTIRTQTFRSESLEPAAEALEALQRDLLCSLVPRGVTNPPFVLIPAGADEPGSFSLHLFTASPGAGSNDWRAYGIREVRYSLEPDEAPGRYALVRRDRPFRTAPPAARPARPGRSEQAPRRGHTPAGQGVLPGGIGTPGLDGLETNMAGFAAETLLRPLAGLDIRVYNGQGWTNGWGTGDTAKVLPQAARISLRLDLPSGPQTAGSETLIPAGHKIKPPAKLEKSGDTLRRAEP